MQTERENHLYYRDTGKVIQLIQSFVWFHSDKVQDADRLTPAQQKIMRQKRETYRASITFHGLRHSFVQQLETEFDTCDLEARKIISNLLGHKRDDVVRIYSHLY
jgi:integrase